MAPFVVPFFHFFAFFFCFLLVMTEDESLQEI